MVDDSSPVGTIAGSSRLVASVYAHHLQILFQCVLPCPLCTDNLPPAIFGSSFLGLVWLPNLFGGSHIMCPVKRLLFVAYSRTKQIRNIRQSPT